MDSPKLHEVAAAVLPALHLRINHSAILTLAVDIVHFGDEAGLSHGGVEDVVEVDGDLRSETRSAAGSVAVPNSINIR